MSELQTITLSLAADFSVLSELRALVLHLSRTSHLSEIEATELALAVDEAATNIIEHTPKANGCDLNCTLTGDAHQKRISIEIQYKATGLFEPRTAPPLADIHTRVLSKRRGGLGVYLMHSLVDDISYTHENGENVIRLVKLHVERV